MQTIWQHVQRNLTSPRKLGLLLVVLALGLLLWGRLLLKEIPRTATARPEPTATLKSSQTPTKSDPQWSDTQVRPAAVGAEAADQELQDEVERELRRAD